MNEIGAYRWVAPDPRVLPDWRAQMVEHMSGLPAMVAMRAAIEAGRINILPTVPGMDASPGAIAAQLLCRSEVDRLERAALYYATADMTSLALAAAQTPPTEPMTLRRLPSPAGLIVFAEPIGGYTEDAAAALEGTLAHRPGAHAEVTTPIVAASWSEWSPHSMELDRGSIHWHWAHRGEVLRIRSNWSGVWVTFYSPRGLFSGLPPETVIGTTQDGSVMTAGDIDQHIGTSDPALQWDNEILMAPGAPFGEPEPDTTDQWMHVLYTAWQLMGQEGKSRLTEVEEVPRNRAGRKRDARQGISEPGAVRIVHLHSAHRPARRAAEEDAEGSTGRRAPQWSCRWPVRPYRRNTCLNPRAHSEGGCEHEDRIVPAHIKGPAGKPLRTGETVNLWDRVPE